MKQLTKILVVFLIYTGCASTTSVKDKQQDMTPMEKLDIEFKEDVKVTPVEAPKKLISATEEQLNQALKKQNDSEIITASQDVLMANPAHVKALNALGLTHYKKGNYKAAEFFINKALKQDPSNSALVNNMAMVKLAQGEERETLKILRNGLGQNGKDIAISANLGSMYLKQKNFKNAEYALETVYKSGSKDVKALTNYAVALAANDKKNEATQIYEKLMAENSSSREIMLNYSIHLIDNLKNNKQGLEILNRLKFVGAPPEAKNMIKDLENRAKAGLK